VVRKSLGGRVSLGGERHSGVSFYGVVACLGSDKLAAGAAAIQGGSLATLLAQRLKLSFSLAGYQKSVPIVTRRGFLYSSRWNLLSEKRYCASPLLLIFSRLFANYFTREKARGPRCSRESRAPTCARSQYWCWRAAFRQTPRVSVRSWRPHSTYSWGYSETTFPLTKICPTLSF